MTAPTGADLDEFERRNQESRVCCNLPDENMVVTLIALARRAQRMEELLRRWYQSGCPDCSGDCRSANPLVPCCIVQEILAILSEPGA